MSLTHLSSCVALFSKEKVLYVLSLLGKEKHTHKKEMHPVTGLTHRESAAQSATGSNGTK